MHQDDYAEPLLPLEATDTENSDAEQRECDLPAEPVRRCGSCGGPIDTGDVCLSCRHAFEWVFDDTAVGALKDETAATPMEAGADPGITSFDDIAEPPHAGDAAAQPTAPAEQRTAARARRINPTAALVVGAGALFLLPIVGVLVGTRGAPASESPDQAVGQAARPAAGPGAGTAAAGATVAQTSAADALPEKAGVDTGPKGAPPTSRTPTRPSPSARPTRAVAASASGSGPARSSPEPASGPADVVAAVVPVESAPAPAPPPAPVAARADNLVLPQPPTGRFFDARDVDESPKVATRVSPRLPPDLQQPVDDVVIVRMLVSQSGHPFRVSLLRRSKVGGAVDDAVITAVKQWTFSPARKSGEAVSCWLNFGVPVSAD